MFRRIIREISSNVVQSKWQLPLHKYAIKNKYRFSVNYTTNQRNFIHRRRNKISGCNDAGYGLVLSASVLSWLGLKKEDVEPETEISNNENIQDIVETIKSGVSAIEKGEFERAKMVLHIALKMAQDINHDQSITYIYCLLADLTFQQDDYIQAENLFKSIISRLLSKGENEKCNAIIEASLKLAIIYGNWNQHEKARTGFLYCIDAQEEKIKSKCDSTEDTVVLWIYSHDMYAQYLLNHGRYKEAFQQFQDAFLTCCELFGDTHSQSLVLLNSLGTVCSLMGDDEKAVNYLKKAVRLGKATNSENLTTFMVNLGMSQIKLGLKNDANAICHDALMMAKLNNLSEVCQEALECLKLSENS